MEAEDEIENTQRVSVKKEDYYLEAINASGSLAGEEMHPNGHRAVGKRQARSRTFGGDRTTTASRHFGRGRVREPS